MDEVDLHDGQYLFELHCNEVFNNNKLQYGTKM
jgi:hypothetical protein